MVNRRKFDRSLYNPNIQSHGASCQLHHPEDAKYYPNSSIWHGNTRTQDFRNYRHNNYYNNYRSMQRKPNYSSERIRDFKHACSVCPGDFSHTSCKYCLNEVEDLAPPENYDEQIPPDYSCSLHEPRRHYFNTNCGACSEPSYFDDPPISFLNNTRLSRNAYGQISRENYCEFCFKNGETAVIYKSHQLRNPSGSIACPLLREYVCCSCGILGDEVNMDKSHLTRCGLNDPFLETFTKPGFYDSSQNGCNSKKKFTCLYCTPNGKEYCDGSHNLPMKNFNYDCCPPRFSNGLHSKYEYFDML